MVCSKCKEEKAIEEFNKDSNRKNGFKQPCKDCVNKRVREYYKKYPERKRISNKKWDSKNRNEYQRQYNKKQKSSFK
jgi:hypothetical protein